MIFVIRMPIETNKSKIIFMWVWFLLPTKMINIYTHVVGGFLFTYWPSLCENLCRIPNTLNLLLKHMCFNVNSRSSTKPQSVFFVVTGFTNLKCGIFTPFSSCGEVALNFISTWRRITCFHKKYFYFFGSVFYSFHMEKRVSSHIQMLLINLNW
jgi:hypothetical protein